MQSNEWWQSSQGDLQSSSSSSSETSELNNMMSTLRSTEKDEELLEYAAKHIRQAKAQQELINEVK